MGGSTDAFFRFERGIDPNITIYCLKLAAMMVKELAGGTISSEIKDVCAAPAQDFIVELSYEKVYSLVGKGDSSGDNQEYCYQSGNENNQ